MCGERGGNAPTGIRAVAASGFTGARDNIAPWATSWHGDLVSQAGVLLDIEVAFGYVVLRADDHCANKRECVDRPRCADDGPWCADDCPPPTCAASSRGMYSTLCAERGPLVHTTTDTPLRPPLLPATAPPLQR